MVGEIWIILKNVFWKFCEIERFVTHGSAVELQWWHKNSN